MLHHGTRRRRTGATSSRAARCVVVVVLVLGGFASDRAGSQDPPAGSAAAPAFQPGEISIGEPVTLPFGGAAAGTTAPTNGGTGAPPAAAASARAKEEAAVAAARSGWLGMVVAESSVPGRWRVDEVARGGPADLAGIRVGDELRAVNGVAPRNADEVSQALTAIVADQTVGIAIARADEVTDVLVKATPRPVPPAVSRTLPTPTTPGPAPQDATAGDPVRPPGSLPTDAALIEPRSRSLPGDGGTSPPPATPPSFASPSVMAPAPPGGTATAANPTGGAPPSLAGVLDPTPDTSSNPVASSSLPQPPTVLLTPPAAPVEPVPPSRFGPASVAPPASTATPSGVSPFMASPALPTAPAGDPTPGFGASAGSGFASASVPSMDGQRSRPSGGDAVGRSGTPTRRTALGVRTIPIDPVTQARFQLSAPDGAYVIGVIQDLPASRAGVPPGSVIVALDERPVHSPTELTSLVSRGPVDRPVRVRYVLPGGTAHDADVVLQPIEPPLLQALGVETSDSPAAVGESRVARKPVEDSVTNLRREIGVLRESLRRLEQRLDGLTGRVTGAVPR